MRNFKSSVCGVGRTKKAISEGLCCDCSVLRFNAPEDSGELFTLALFVCSDTFFGIDQQYEISVKTA